MTRHVSVRPNGSATRTAFLSVFHQQFIGFVATVPALVAADDCAPRGDTAHPRHQALTSTRPIRRDVLLMPCLDPYAPTSSLRSRRSATKFTSVVSISHRSLPARA